jgi:hypothetical protein
MVAEFIRRGKAAPHESLESLVMDIMGSGREQGFRASETTTKTKSKPTFFTYPGSLRKVIKAICRDWWLAYDIIKDVTAEEGRVFKLKIRWKIQKNRRNNEPVTYTRDDDNPDFCVVTRTLSMIKRAKNLGQSDNLPLAVYRDKNGKTVYLTAKDLTDYIRNVARSVHPTMPESEIMKFSCHSIRVWACVLLHEAGKDGEYIKKRLRWLSECYRVYLRDTEGLASQHNQSLREYADLIKAMTTMNLPDDVNYTIGEDEEMGTYDDPDG